MAIICTAYDRGSFLDEYRPHVSPTKEKKKQPNAGEFRRRCFSEMPMTNNPLSKFRHCSKRNKSQRKTVPAGDKAHENIEIVPFERTFSDSKVTLVVDQHDKNIRIKRESADRYFSGNPKENRFYLTDTNELKYNDTDPIIDEEISENKDSDSSSSFIKKKVKFLQCKYNIKLGKSQESRDAKTSSPEQTNGHVTKEKYKEQTAETPVSKSKKMSWKSAKRHASIIVRFLKRDLNREDQIALVRAASIRMSRRKFYDNFTKDHNQETLNGMNNVDNVQTLLNDQSMQSIFDDSFVSLNAQSDDLSNSPSPIGLKYITARNISRPRPHRNRAKSLHALPKSTSVNENAIMDDNNNKNFVIKYLNRSKSLEEVRENIHDEHKTNIFSLQEDPFADFEPDITVHCKPDTSFSILSTLIEDDENEDDIEHEELTRAEFQNMVEKEVDEYILNGVRNDDDNSLVNKKDYLLEDSTLSYSVNNLYDLLNKDSLLTFDCDLDGILI